jgi:hypothetical protein
MGETLVAHRSTHENPALAGGSYIECLDITTAEFNIVEVDRHERPIYL